MAKWGNDHTKAVHLAASQIDAVIKSMEQDGNFMGRTPSAKTQAKHDRIDAAPPDVRRLLDQGFSQAFVDRLARLSEEK